MTTLLVLLAYTLFGLLLGSSITWIIERLPDEPKTLSEDEYTQRQLDRAW